MKFIAALISIVLGVVLLVAANDLPIWGDPESPVSVHLSRYFIEHSVEETSVPNFVTAVLADYRGYDTMFETAVIFCAGITVMTILRRSHRRQKKNVPPRPVRHGQDIIICSAARLIVPMMQLFALYVLAHGHHSPGGGFQGGVIFGASFILLAIVYDLQMVLTRIKEKSMMLISGLGVLLYAGIGVICMFLGGNFLDYSLLTGILQVSELEARSHGILGVEVGVALTVTCIMLSLYADLASGGEMDEGL